MLAVAIAAIDAAFQHAMMERLVELLANLAVAIEAELGGIVDQYVTGALLLMRQMAIIACHRINIVKILVEALPLLLLFMAAQATLGHFFRCMALEIEDPLATAPRPHVLAAGAVTGFTTFIRDLPLRAGKSDEMGGARDLTEFIRVAHLAGIRADIIRLIRRLLIGRRRSRKASPAEKDERYGNCKRNCCEQFQRCSAFHFLRSPVLHSSFCVKHKNIER